MRGVFAIFSLLMTVFIFVFFNAFLIVLRAFSSKAAERQAVKVHEKPADQADQPSWLLIIIIGSGIYGLFAVIFANFLGITH